MHFALELHFTFLFIILIFDIYILILEHRALRDDRHGVPIEEWANELICEAG